VSKEGIKGDPFSATDHFSLSI